jgi:hypothetical protein
MPASDYFIDIGDPFAKSIAAFRGAYGDVERLRRFDEERQERQRVAQERQSGMDALQNLARLGNNATSGDYMSALAANPAFGQQIGAMQKTFGAERSANELRFGQRLFSALAGDNIDLSKQMLDERIAAYRNAGDNRAADSAQAIRLMLDKPGGLGAARASVGMTLANGMGDSFDKFLKQFYPQQKEMTAETRGRLEQLRLAGIDPASPEGRRFVLTGSLGEATPEGASPLGKIAQDVQSGLIPKSVLDVAMRIEEKQAASDEGLTLQQKISEEARLRGEYTKRTEDLAAAERNFQVIQVSAADDSGAGDIALVTSFMKMLDPGSVVRETEFATAANAGGLLARLRSLATKVENGQFLSADQRADFQRLAGQYLKAARDQEGPVRKSYQAIIENYGLNPVNVFGTRAVTAAPPAVPPGAAAAPATSTPPQSFLDDQKIRQIANSRGLTIEQIWQQLPDEMRKRYAGN